MRAMLAVWSILYAAIGIASWRVWQAGNGVLPLSLYGVQLLLNFAWSPIFFQKHDLKLACADITGELPWCRMCKLDMNPMPAGYEPPSLLMNACIGLMHLYPVALLIPYSH